MSDKWNFDVSEKELQLIYRGLKFLAISAELDEKHDCFALIRKLGEHPEDLPKFKHEYLR